MKSAQVSSIAAVLFFFVQATLNAQDPPITWGSISMDHLTMKSFPGDTNASALILCDYGEVNFDDDLNLVFNRHCRVKILTPKGYEWGTVSVSTYDKDNTEDLRELEGCTYSLDSTGAIVSTPLDSDDIFEEKSAENYTSHKFTLPALSPGCVIEYRYSKVMRGLHMMPDWVFQKSEPVLWSEYVVRFPRLISYATVTQGYEPFAVSRRSEVNLFFGSPATNYLGASSGVVPCFEQRFAVRNAPALRDEPFVTTMADYSNRVSYQLAGYAFAGMGRRDVLRTWPALIEEVLDNDRFGGMIDVTGDVEDLVGTLTADLSTPEEKLRSVFHWVATSIVWDGANRVTADQDPDEVLETKRGTNAEITFLLLSLLRGAKIECHPVLASTRSNGRIQDLYPIVDQFNYVLARATVNGKHYYLDATDPLRPMEILPSKLLNVRGLIVREGSVEWATLTSPARHARSGVANLRIFPDGNIAGDLEVQFKGYANIDVRRDLKDKKDLEIAKEVFNAEEEGLTIDSVLITGRDNDTVSLTVKAWISSDLYAQRAGDMIYVNPTILFRIKENPFKTQERNFPIDYGFGRESVSTVRLMFPEGYELKEKYLERGASISSDIRFARRKEMADGSLTLSNSFIIAATMFQPNVYERLRDLYAVVVSHQSEQIVLGKIQSGPMEKKSAR